MVWDWSVQFDKDKTLKDVYFTDLPNHLSEKNIKCARLLWVEPQHKPGSKRRSLKSVIKHVKNHPQLILVQKIFNYYRYPLCFFLISSIVSVLFIKSK